MYTVCIVGDQCSGKSSLLSQWEGQPVTNSYLMTIEVDKHTLTLPSNETIIVYDTPSHGRIQLEPYYMLSDLIIIMASKDTTDLNKWYSKGQPKLLILNGPFHSFHKCRLWALYHDIRVISVDICRQYNTERALEILMEMLEDVETREVSIWPETLETWCYYL